MNRPEMAHLPGFWRPQEWGDDKWAVYQRRRRTRWQRVRNRFEQIGHWLIGRTLPWEYWLEREAAQWARGSGAGAYDHAEDHFWAARGAGHVREAYALLAAARERRPGFLA